ncbi:BTAD domain-containing putative transcriptional regulator [Tardiphaga sp. 20_F10_N6_6]|uniref:BTAD domain-containing putative transcriptional regulator n=1 Tax=Tardiphaga sp. 20_F10_N6_6 TaxID=3240788 RepID=UPI003F8AD17F
MEFRWRTSKVQMSLLQELTAGRIDQALQAGHRAHALNNMRDDVHRLTMQALAPAGPKR